jgi:DNA-binding NarL/FixJ family response regulator
MAALTKVPVAKHCGFCAGFFHPAPWYDRGTMIGHGRGFSEYFIGCDDHAITRDGTALLLEQTFPGVRVLHADDCANAVAIARCTPLNLVLLDIDFSGHGRREGIAALLELKGLFESLCVVMFSGIDDDRELVFEVLKKGAMGFIPKKLSRLEFIEALKDVISGRPYLPASAIGPGVFAARRDEPAKGGPCPREPTRPQDLGLTPREFEVLRWVIHGKSNKEIARSLGIEVQTVKNHLRPIFNRFNVTKRTELIVAVFRLGIVPGVPEVGNPAGREAA